MRAQIFAQPFIIIFSLIVAVSVLIFGFKAILDLREKSDYVQLLDAQSELKEVIRTFYTFAAGSEKTITLRVPKKISCFCFLDKDEPINDIPQVPSSCTENDPESLRNTIKTDGGQYHLYVTPSKLYTITKFTLLSHIKTQTGSLLCLPAINGKVNIKVTSQGSYVSISSQS